MTKINIDTNEAICLQCDIGYIHPRKRLEETHIEWTVSKEIPQMEWRDKFETHFEWKHVHSLHSLGAKNTPISITFILTLPGSNASLGSFAGADPGGWPGGQDHPLPPFETPELHKEGKQNVVHVHANATRFSSYSNLNVHWSRRSI